jgi:hypothetical protein
MDGSKAGRFSWAMKASVAAGVMLAGLLAAGCTHGTASARRASVASCTRFSLSALKRHVTVTSLPAACQGLTKAQVNFAADSALDAIIGTVHGKVRMRARVLELSPLLVHLVNTAPAQRGPPAASASSAARASGPPLALVALATWLITVGLGFVMLARWVTRGGLRRTRVGQAGYAPAMNVAHLGLAMAGLVTWTIYLVTGLTSLAWIACALLLPVAGLGCPSRPNRSGGRWPGGRSGQPGPATGPAPARPGGGGACRLRRGHHPVRCPGRCGLWIRSPDRRVSS